MACLHLTSLSGGLKVNIKGAWRKFIFKDVTPPKALVKEYEFKDGDLRVYGISKFGGKVIIMGGYKNRQKKDYRTFRSLKEQYLCQEKITSNETGRTSEK